jgi:hypothetical protein
MRKLIITALLVSPLPAIAQQEERLPDLTPQEFEIRGDLQVSLPDLERQPLRGFAPPPRAYVVPADRQPFVAPYAQRLDDLPANPLPTAAPPSLMGAIPRTGQVDLLAGRYFGRRARLTLNAGGFGLDALYHGHSEFAAGNGRSETIDADNLRGRLSFSGGDRLRYELAADGLHHRYDIPGAYRPLGILDDQADRPPGRQFTSIGFEGGLSGTALPVPFDLRLRYGTAQLEDYRLPALPDSVLTTDEARLMASGSLDVGPVEVDGRVNLLGLDESGIGNTLLDFDTGLSFAVPVGTGRLRAGARLFGFETSTSSGDRSMVRVGPLVEFDAPLGTGIRYYAWNRAGAHSRGLVELMRENPYVHPSPTLAPDLHLVNAETGIEVQLAPVLLTLSGGATFSPNRLYFERIPDPFSFDPSGGPYVARYDKASLYRGGASVTFYGPANISASAGLELRRARLTEQGRSLPYVAPLVWRASLMLPFDAGRGLVQVSLHGEGERPTENSALTVPGWSDLTVETRYRLAGRFGLVARGDHLAGRAERWPGFPRPPAMITAGLRAAW